MSSSCDVRIEYFAPDARLRRYFSAFFLIEVSVPGGGMVEDCYFPEWATLRFFSNLESAGLDNEQQWLGGSAFAVTGHHAKPLHFRIGNTRLWTLNLNPLGWTRLIGRPAHEFANAKLYGHHEPAFAPFRPLADSLFGDEPDPQGELDRISAFLNAMALDPTSSDQRIEDIYVELMNPQHASVKELADKLGLTQRTLERVCRDAFGFSPKLLLRRQRFMRTITDFMIDPTLKWIGAMDAHYHDQAQFIRDFRQFMGMTPGEYAARDKPVMDLAVRKRVQYSRDIVRHVRRQGDTRDFGVSL